MIRSFLETTHITPFCVIIGDPVSHSLSPLLHNEAFRLSGLNWTYHKLLVHNHELDLLEEVFTHPDFRGANITVPYKTAVMDIMEMLHPMAEKVGAVNTVVIDDDLGAIIGHNTDVAGFLDPLLPLRARLKGSDALVFGSGGAQKAVTFALKKMGMRNVRVVSRTPDSGSEHQISYSDVPVVAADTLLWVNATPLGLPSHAGKSPLDGLDFRFSQDQIGYDLLYKPRITPFLARFQVDGAHVIGGMEMFIGQAKRSFQLWTGQEMPPEAVNVLK